MSEGTQEFSLCHKQTQEIFGRQHSFSFAVMVTVTCFTTTVGLIVSTAEFFNGRFPQISYKVYATVFTLIGFAIANLGLSAIIKYSVPVLVILYPITITIVMIVIVNKFAHFRGMQLTVGLVTAASRCQCIRFTFKIDFLMGRTLYHLRRVSPWLAPAIIEFTFLFSKQTSK